MSDSTDPLRAAYRAFRKRGAEGLMPYLDEGVVIDEAPEFPDTGTFHGHEGARKLVALFTETLEDFRMEPREFVQGSDDRVLISLDISGTARASGVPVQIQSFHVHTLQDHRIVRMQVFLNADDARNAAGLAE